MDLQTSSKISGIGINLPTDRISSDELMREIGTRRFGIPENFISRKMGIIERRFATPESRPSDLAYAASVEAIEEAGIDPRHIDWIIFCGIDRDWIEPSTACRIQHLLGATNASCVDVSNACLGFMNGLHMADTLIRSGSVENVLVCTGETQSNVALEMVERLRRCDDKQFFRKTMGALTVGDAGGAMIIQRSDGNNGFHRFQFWTEGDKAELCCIKEGRNGFEGQMIMGVISKAMVEIHSKHIDGTYLQSGWKPSDVDKLYCHQVGREPHKQMANIARVPEDKAPITYHTMGNLTSATIPVNMYINRPRRGEHILFMGAGSGLSVCQSGMTY